MKYSILILLLVSKFSFSQNLSNVEIYRYVNKDAIIFDYSILNSNYLLNKHFKLENDESKISDFYSKFNFNLFSPTQRIGEFVLNDTLDLDENISFDDINFSIKSIICNNSNYRFTENKYGFYLVNIIIRHNFYNDDIIRIAFKVLPNSVIIESQTDFNFVSYHQLLPQLIAYNDKSVGYDYIFENGERKMTKSVNIEVAKQQLYYMAVLLETRQRLISMVNQYYNDVKN
jgi:hypothetical protein